MFSDVHKHITQKLGNSKIITQPYPYIVVDDIFPVDFYKFLIANPIPKENLVSLRDSNRVGNGYSAARYVLNLEASMPVLDGSIREFYENIAKYFDYFFKNMLLNKFNVNPTGVITDLLYTKDYRSYSLGPHTDKISKVLTCLIYLPSDNSKSKYGTSIYVPKDKNFKCEGGPHHKRNEFELYKTIPFEPNKMFCFLKTNSSFHGVEPVDEKIERDLLIFDLQKNDV